MTKIPEILYPLVAKSILREDQILTYWKDTRIYIFPPGSSLTVNYIPRVGYVYIVFAIQLGKVRDWDSGDQLITDDYGFWHRHGQMRWHWDPGTESVYDFEYPEFLEVTEDDPLQLEFVNGTAFTIIHDYSIFILECTKEAWPRVTQYLKGVFNFFYALGGMEARDVEKAFSKLLKEGKGR